MTSSSPRDPLTLIMGITNNDAVGGIGQLADAIISWPVESRDSEKILRHLAALAFRLDGSGMPGLAARVYDIAANLSQRDSERWRLAAAERRLSEIYNFCKNHQFDEATQVATLLQKTDISISLHQIVKELVEPGWSLELNRDLAGCLQCYRFAFELSRKNSAILTVDGQTLNTKLRKLARLQLDILTEAMQFEEAIILHSKIQSLIESGPLSIYEIVSAKALEGSTSASYMELLPSRPVPSPNLKFLGAAPLLNSEAGELIAPPQYLCFIEKCTAFPRSNLVISGDKLVYDAAAHHRRDDILIQDGVLSDQIVMAGFGATRALVEKPLKTLSIDAGLSMFGLQSRNYGHWFCEFVPRMLVYNDQCCPDGIPICIDDHMPATHEEVISLLDKRSRPIIKLPAKAIEFGSLGLAPVPAFFPFEMKPGRRVYDTIWPSDILISLRECILHRARMRGALSDQSNRRLFISRKAFAQRQLTNEAEIIDALMPHGFEVIYPETMTFLEQIDAFHSAEIIIGSSSSALTNGLFCRPECQILGLIHENLSFNFRGYTSFIEAGGAQITFLRGQTLTEAGHAFHANYSVAPSEVINTLKLWKRESARSITVPHPQYPFASGTIFNRLRKNWRFGRRKDF